MGINTIYDLPLAKAQRKIYNRMVSCKEDIYISFLLPKVLGAKQKMVERMQEPEVVDDEKEQCHLGMTGQLHT